MKVIKEIPPKHSRQLKHTMVQGRDGKFYKILTQQLYERQPRGEFSNFETNVQEVEENGSYKVLFTPFLKRFATKEEAIAMHERILDDFDNILKLKEPEKPKHAPKVEVAH